jgi:hypothetical protein
LVVVKSIMLGHHIGIAVGSMTPYSKAGGASWTSTDTMALFDGPVPESCSASFACLLVQNLGLKVVQKPQM